MGSRHAAGRQSLETIIFRSRLSETCALCGRRRLGTERRLVHSSPLRGARRNSACTRGNMRMRKFDRRSLLRASAALAAAGTLARPYVANAAAKTAHVWWTQGFIAEEDAALKKMVADYEKASGNILDVSIIPFGPIVQKIVSALTSGDVPDLMENNNSANTIVPQNVWTDKFVDVTDVVETQKSHFHPTALLGAQYYNNVIKKRSFYLVPVRSAVLPFHIWNSM